MLRIVPTMEMSCPARQACQKLGAFPLSGQFNYQ